MVQPARHRGRTLAAHTPAPLRASRAHARARVRTQSCGLHAFVVAEQGFNVPLYPDQRLQRPAAGWEASPERHRIGCRAGIRTPTKGSKGPLLDSEASVAQVNSARQLARATPVTSPVVASFGGNQRTISGRQTHHPTQATDTGTRAIVDSARNTLRAHCRPRGGLSFCGGLAGHRPTSRRARRLVVQIESHCDRIGGYPIWRVT
jgi:hypothetical protein